MRNTVKRLFSTKKPKMELTIRTPYKTVITSLSDFIRVVTRTSESYLIVQNRMPPAAHVLPPGFLKVRMEKEIEGFSGDLMHLGGWLVIHPDNSCEINVMDIVERKDIATDKLDKGEQEPTEEGISTLYVNKIKSSSFKSFLKQTSN